MKTLLLNVFVCLLAMTPLGVLELCRRRFRWTREHHGQVSLVVWLITLFAIWMLVLPRLGLTPNPRVYNFY